MRTTQIQTTYELLCDTCCTMAHEGDPVVSLSVQEVEFDETVINGETVRVAEAYPLGTLSTPEYFGLYVVTQKGYAYHIEDYAQLGRALAVAEDYKSIPLLYNLV